MSHRLKLTIVLILCGISVGCHSDFDDTRVRLVAGAGTPVHIDSEQVSMTQNQVDCGVDKDLWDPPEVVSERSVAHLRQAARDLGFTDDISINEPGYTLPYSQMRGDFLMHVDNIIDTKDGPGEGIKTVVLQLRVHVPHDCFASQDLPIMGIRKGQFNPNLPVTLVFALDQNGWRVDHFVH